MTVSFGALNLPSVNIGEIVGFTFLYKYCCCFSWKMLNSFNSVGLRMKWQLAYAVS